MKNVRLLLVLLIILPVAVFSQIDSIQFVQKINNVVGGLSGSPLGSSDSFGHSVEVIGDVNHDGFDDIAVGAPGDDDGITNRGAVYILMLDSDGTVKNQQKISQSEGNAPSFSTGHINFGSAIAAIGDLNGDGNIDIAVGGKKCDDDGTNTNQGAVYILFLSDSGTVLEYQKISDHQGGGPGTLDAGDFFGSNISNIGDLNGDGLPEIAITAINDDDGGTDVGAVYIGFLDYDGTLKNIQKISATTGGFGGTLSAGDSFGFVSNLGDINKDGVNDIVIGAPKDDDGGTDIGAVWICFMNSDGTVASEQKISDISGGFEGTLDDGDFFGVVLGIDDLDNDGLNEIIVSAPNDDDGGTDEGALWVLYIGNDGKVKNYDKISTTDVFLSSEVEGGDRFGIDISYFGDRNNDGKIDLLIGADQAVDDSSIASGEIYIVHLEGSATYPNKIYYETNAYVSNVEKYSAVQAPLSSQLGGSDYYGVTSCRIGDLNGDGVDDLAVGAYADDDGGTDRGAVYIQFLNADGTIDSIQKISSTQGNFSGSLTNGDLFGLGLGAIGDLDSNGIPDIAVCAPKDDDGGTDRGAIWILFLEADGTVKSEQKISSTDGNFSGALDNGDWFGYSLTGIGDIDGDGVLDMAAGARFDDDGGTDRGAVWILFLDTNGTVKSEQKISDSYGDLTTSLDNSDWFGSSVTLIGDFDDDGVNDIAVGAYADDDGGTNRGAFYILTLRDTGTVKAEYKISSTSGNFNGLLEDNYYFGKGIEGGFDLDLDGVNDIIIGGYGSTNGGSTERGEAWILFMNTDGTVNHHKTISSTSNKLTNLIDDGDRFGLSISVLDYDTQGNTSKIAIGSYLDDDGSANAGAVYAISFKLLNGYNNYAKLKDKLDGGFHKFTGKSILFKYEEKYRTGNLNYEIYEYKNQTLLSSNTLTVPKRYGDNWLSISMCQFNCLNNHYYVLEVSDEKGRKEYLRFYVDAFAGCFTSPTE